uniref:Uncharacterized protein n=1 Tax=Corethron hystrix TaxID=216773 RepID=A0A7S1BBV7_9STRA
MLRHRLAGPSTEEQEGGRNASVDEGTFFGTIAALAAEEDVVLYTKWRVVACSCSKGGCWRKPSSPLRWSRTATQSSVKSLSRGSNTSVRVRRLRRREVVREEGSSWSDSWRECSFSQVATSSAARSRVLKVASSSGPGSGAVRLALLLPGRGIRFHHFRL